ncbi:magnesium chelatase [Candidatus Parcubacteria bacterium]|nr:MAG: magnesium chelatase [Candidatus Parcubacteria bacterium]
MSSKVLSAAVVGLDAEIVEVEADIGHGEMGNIAIVGLPDMAVSESKERVRSAIKNSNLPISKRRLVVNLAPADLRKHGPSYDLPIAVAVLLASGKLTVNGDFTKMLFVGELALNGDLRRVNGVLPITLKAKREGIKQIFLPKENAVEASLVKDIEVIGVSNLLELAKHLSGQIFLSPEKKKEFNFQNKKILFDMAHIKGQEHVKRAMEISAAGAHNMMMSGPPGSGKTLIARTMPSILPNLTLEEALEITKIYSVAGELPEKQALVDNRPFRSPHHTSSGVALVGGGTWPRPGEISLAHRGVLFLDEFAEFSRSILENLRQPLEDGVIHISRAAGNLSFPAKFILVSAMNPCPCGYSSDPDRTCTCSPNQVINYRKKISGPIMDRIDLHIEVPRIDFEKLSEVGEGESSEFIKKRVEVARKIQAKRFAKLPIVTNTEMNSEMVKQFCVLDNESKQILKSAVEKLHLSARSYYRLLKLARTIADLEGQEAIYAKHVAESLQYRPVNQEAV